MGGRDASPLEQLVPPTYGFPADTWAARFEGLLTAPNTGWVRLACASPFGPHSPDAAAAQYQLIVYGKSVSVYLNYQLLLSWQGDSLQERQTGFHMEAGSVHDVRLVPRARAARSLPPALSACSEQLRVEYIAGLYSEAVGVSRCCRRCTELTWAMHAATGRSAGP
jgi:hypothetical protein